MKQRKWAMLALAAAALCTAAGCTAPQAGTTAVPTATPSAAVSQKPSHSGFADGSTSVGSQSVSLDAPQSLRIPYSSGADSVTCVTSPDQLQAYGVLDSPQLASYDQNFFRTKALVLVQVTTTSGSAQVSLGQAKQVSNVISLSVEAQSSGLGTADMATWLLWAEVDPALASCTWVLEGSGSTGVVE